MYTQTMSNVRLSGSVRNVQTQRCVAGSCAAARAISSTRRARGASSLGRTLGRTNQREEQSQETPVAPADAASAHANIIVTMSTDGDNHSTAIPQFGSWILHIDVSAQRQGWQAAGWAGGVRRRCDVLAGSSISFVGFRLPRRGRAAMMGQQKGR